jgi:hypothetical protein
LAGLRGSQAASGQTLQPPLLLLLPLPMSKSYVAASLLLQRALQQLSQRPHWLQPLGWQPKSRQLHWSLRQRHMHATD